MIPGRLPILGVTRAPLLLLAVATSAIAGQATAGAADPPEAKRQFRTAIAAARKEGIRPGGSALLVKGELGIHDRWKTKDGILRLLGRFGRLPRGCFPVKKTANWRAGRPSWELDQPFAPGLFPAETENNPVNDAIIDLPRFPAPESTEYWALERGRVVIVPVVFGVHDTQNTIVLMGFRHRRGRFFWTGESSEITDYLGIVHLRAEKAVSLGGKRWKLAASINRKPDEKTLGTRGAISAVWDGEDVVEVRSAPASP